MSSLSHACGSGIWVMFLNASPVFLVFFFYVVCTHLSAFECLCHSRQMHQKSHACLRLLGVCPNEASKAALPPSLQHLFITVTRNIIALTQLQITVQTTILSCCTKITVLPCDLPFFFFLLYYYFSWVVSNLPVNICSIRIVSNIFCSLNQLWKPGYS